MATYKTPDVYVKEISLLPPSVAEVETAIPAFIGYTKKYTHNGKSWLYKPKEVASMLDFVEIFGGGPPIEPTVELDPVTSTVTSVDLGANTYYLYDSLRLFFDNGGGKCYIVSVGEIGDPVDIGDDTKGILKGLKALEKEDEPTMLICPDAVSLSDTNLASFQQQALKQAAKLMDRIAVLDIKNSGDHDADIQNFRDNVGINNLKYGAAYTPWLNTAYPKIVKYRSLTLKKGATTMNFRSLTKDTDIRDYIDSLLQPSINGVNSIKTAVTENATLLGGEDTLQEKFVSLYEDVEAASEAYDAGTPSTLTDLKNAVSALLKFNFDVLTAVGTYYAGLPDPGTDPAVTKYAYKLKNDVPTLGADNGIDDLSQDSQQDHVKALEHADVWSQTPTGYTPATFTTNVNNIFGNGTINSNLNTPLKNEYKALFDAGNHVGIAQKAASAAAAYWGALNGWIAEFTTAATSYEDTFDAGLAEIAGSYKAILGEVANALNDCPPSGAVAGVMAYVDETRGVWKAPANVSLNSVIGPMVLINNEEQEDLNVDVNAGKSVNAIRAFTGKGTLIWGARTLAGNDNEWRYVSVRRFYNMVEESVKKSTYWAVFEPNNANTWIRVKAMIENYLKDKWRDGALMGAVPEDAFFVKIGLGQTMTAQDVLEGRMNVEIGMSVVRPAEFIILKFSHFMKEA